MKCIVKAHPETGAVINGISEGKDGEDYGTIRLDQTVLEYSNGFLNPRNRTAFIRGRLSHLEALGLKDGDEFPLEGKIVAYEASSPFWEGQEPKINPGTGEVVMVNGKAVYRKTEFTQDLSAQDDLLSEGSSSSSEDMEDAAIESSIKSEGSE